MNDEWDGCKGETNKMRVCPECKYVDPPEWKHSRYSYWIDFISWENFCRLHPELAKNMPNGGDKTEDELYVYRRMKHGRYVERKAKVDYGYQWNIPMEKVDHSKMPHDFRKTWGDLSQKKLLESGVRDKTKENVEQ